MDTSENTNEIKQIWKYTLVLCLVVLGWLLFRQTLPFINGIMGAFTLFILLRKPTYRLAEKNKPGFAAMIMSAGVTLFIIIPVSLAVWIIFNKLQNTEFHPQNFITPLVQMIDIIKEETGFDLMSEKSLGFIASKISTIGQSVMSSVGDLAVNILVVIVLLYFLLSGGRKLEAYIASVMPFREENKREVLDRIKLMTRSNAIGIPLLALIQGGISWIGYIICGVPNAFVAAIFTGLASIIPMVGTAIVWIPIAIYLFITGNTTQGFVLIAFGAVVISQCDNLIRFILQKKMADTHPLITIFGVIAGLPMFGFMGIIFGPLMVSLFLLFLDMFRKEYLSVGPNQSGS